MTAYKVMVGLLHGRLIPQETVYLSIIYHAAAVHQKYICRLVAYSFILKDTGRYLTIYFVKLITIYFVIDDFCRL